MDRLCEAIHAGPLADPAGSPSAHRVTGPSVEVLFDLLRVELLFMLAAPVNLADLASAGSSDDQHLDRSGRFLARGGWPSRRQLQVGLSNDSDLQFLAIPLLRAVTGDSVFT
jgi:hypothetical protein